MSALRAVLLAIEHATLKRDAMAKALAVVERNMGFARSQMEQLESYSADTDKR